MRTQRFEYGPASVPVSSQDMQDPSLPGTTILGRYTVVRTLGKGGMGIVVAARHIELGGMFAIKFLLPGAGFDQLTLGRFLREAKALARLRGEHIVRVHDVGRLDNGEPYMVMEYLEGRDLKAVLRNGPLPLEDAVLYLLQICDAIAEAHGAGIVHRDLKPGNLYWTTRPNGTVCIKVLDFGISKVVDGESTDYTGDGAIGSLRYMSPEQIKRSREVDFRTDIWALGLIACEFFSGALPFGGRTQFEIMSNIFEQEVEPPSVWRRELPPALDAVVLRCLRKDPDERFQTVAELARAIRCAVGIPDVRAAMPTLPSMTELPPPVQHEDATKQEMTRTENQPAPPQRSLARPVITTMIAVGAATASLVFLVRAQGIDAFAVHSSATFAPVAKRLSQTALALTAPQPTNVANVRAPMAADAGVEDASAADAGFEAADGGKESSIPPAQFAKPTKTSSSTRLDSPPPIRTKNKDEKIFNNDL